MKRVLLGIVIGVAGVVITAYVDGWLRDEWPQG